MAAFTRGFTGRGRAARDPRLPPGQYDTGKRLAGAHRRGDAQASTSPTWTFTVEGLVEQPDDVDVGRDPRARRRRPTRATSTASRPGRSSTCTFTGVSVDTLLARRACSPTATHVLAFSHTGYTTNLPLADVTGGQAWVVWEYEGEPLAGRARRPGPAARAAPLLLEEREVGRRAARARPRRARVLGAQRLPRPRRPVARAALPG